MKYLLTAFLLVLTNLARAEVVEIAKSGTIRFNDFRNQGSPAEQVINVDGRLAIAFELSAMRDDKGREFVGGVSKATNNTNSALHYLLYLALYDKNKNLITVLNSEDVFSAGVQPRKAYQFHARAHLPNGFSQKVRAYQLILYISDTPLVPKLGE